MFSIDSKLEEQIRQTLEARILESRETVSNFLASIRDRGQVPWVPYVKRYDVQLDQGTTSYKPIVGLAPYIGPFLSLRRPDGSGASLKELFDTSEIIIQSLENSTVRLAGKPRIRRATREMILVALEASELNIPNEFEIRKRVRDNLKQFFCRCTKKTTRFRSIAPIAIGAAMNNAVVLGDVHFRRPTEQDLSAILVASDRFSYEPPLFGVGSSSVLVLEQEIDLQPDPQRYDLDESMRLLHNSFKEGVQDALLALRLGGEVNVGIDRVFHVDVDWTTPESLGVVTVEPRFTYEPPRTRTVIPSASRLHEESLDTAEVTAIYNSVCNFRKDGDKNSLQHFDVAIRRLDMTYGKTNPVEQLIDVVIAFEALIMVRKKHRRRLSNWAAALVDSDTKTKKDIKRDMTKIYDLRSDIVHGDELPKPEDLQRYVPVSKDYLCAVLRKILQLTPKQTLKQIRDEYAKMGFIDKLVESFAF